ncbi:MAG: outer membrane lipoprotein carrier protein LolA [Planctomycetes bacterium]|nr:outer membrane lipoprotein carrier protein LolA [Planctomycetota bacterium]
MRILTPACLLIVVAAAAVAADANLLDRVQAASKDIATVRVPFVQEKKLAILEEPVITKGVIEISRPLSSVRWEFTGRSVLIFSKGKVRRWGAEGKEESAGSNDPGLKSFHDQMEAFLSGDWNGLKSVFDVVPDPDGGPLLKLTPKNKDIGKYISRIDLRFRDDLTAPARMTLTATAGDETTYTFSDPEVGADLPASRFSGP